MFNWTTTTTLDSSIYNVEELQPIDEKIIMDLHDAYMGVDGVAISLKKGIIIDENHKGYFRAFLKEESLKSTLMGKGTLVHEYKNFFFEQFPEKAKNGNAGFFSKLANSKKLPEEDAMFFGNLQEISDYITRHNDALSQDKINEVVNHRKEYAKSLRIRGNGEFTNYLKEYIVLKRHEGLRADFYKEIEAAKGTICSVAVTNTFVDESMKIFNDFKSDSFMLSDDFRIDLFNIAYKNYSNIIRNEQISDIRDAVFSLNNVHEKIFGKKEEIVKIEINDGGVAYHLIKNPYSK